MAQRDMRAGLEVEAELCSFIERAALPGTGIAPEHFWAGFSALVHDLSPKNRALLAKRADLQRQIDDWHLARRDQVHDREGYKAFLEQIGYLLPEAAPFQIDTQNVDPEIATIAGPQLVVPITNARYALNAANARWGSLYDAFYGTDAMGSQPPAGGMNKGAARGLWRGCGCFWMRPFRWRATATPMRGSIMSRAARFWWMANRWKSLQNLQAIAAIPARRNPCFWSITGCMWNWSSTAPI